MTKENAQETGTDETEMANPAVKRNIEFVKKKFSEFYTRYKVSVPNIEQREFGVGNWEKKIAVRHMSFRSESELRNYLINEAPLYISYSTAYYEFPSNRPMEAKNWLGADMVFDLDAETGGKRFPTEEMLDEVKERTVRLIEEFLIPDFGYSKDELSVNFSGSKGYHVHIKDERLLPLSSDARRQIIDYIQGTMVDINSMLSFSGNKVIGPTRNEKGWPGRIAVYVYNHPEFFYPKKASDQKFLNDWRRTLDSGNWYFVVQSKRMQDVVKKASVKFSDDVDTQVSTDVHRLIRVPNTLHGGSGLCAVKIKTSALLSEKFDPLKHAVVFGDEDVKIHVTEDVPKLTLKDRTFDPIPKDKTVVVPLYYAMYLICHKAADILEF